METKKPLPGRTAGAPRQNDPGTHNSEPWLPPNLAIAARSQFEHRLNSLVPVGMSESSAVSDQPDVGQWLSQEVLAAQRQAVIRVPDRGEISDQVVHRIFHELDLSGLRPVL